MKKIFKQASFALLITAIMLCTASCKSNAPPKPTDDSLSALLDASYSNAVRNGYTGSIEEWMAELFTPSPKGKDGKDGKDGIDGKDGKDGIDGKNGKDGRDGLDAYDEALKNGFEGSYAQWLSSMEAGEYFISVTDYALPNTAQDVSAQIQQAIDDNPFKTVYFPDGVYLISTPITTPSNSTALVLAEHAVIKAADNWQNVCTDSQQDKNGTYSDCMIRLNAEEPLNDEGHDSIICGGIIDGSGIANGLSVDSGNDARLYDISIINTYIGLHIKYGITNASSTVDIFNLSVTGNGEAGSRGVLCRGYDNSFTNIRISNVQYGMHLTGAGNFIRNVKVSYTGGNGFEYADSIGIWDTTDNFLDTVHSEQFATAFRFSGYLSSYDGCIASWHSDEGKQTAFYCPGHFNGVLNNVQAYFCREENDCVFFYTKNHSTGQLTLPMFDPNKCDPSQNNYTDYVSNDQIIKIQGEVQ